MELDSGALVRLKNKNKNRHYKLVRQFETASGLKGWWVIHPNGWYTVIKPEDIKEVVSHGE